MKRILIVLTAVVLGAASAYAGGNMLLHVGSADSGSAPTGCASTGIFDLSNTCNDIYFIGALK